MGGVVAGIGVAAAAAGAGTSGTNGVPSDLLLVSGSLTTSAGVTVMSLAGLSARKDPLERSTSGVGAYLGLGLAGASGFATLSLLFTSDPATADTLRYGGAGVAAVAVVPAAAQLITNGRAWQSRTRVSTVPVLGPEYAGGRATILF